MMYGNTITTAYSDGTNSFGGSNQAEEPDTMHNNTTNGIGGSAYYIGTGPRENGGNQPVVLYTCGGATIDSINESGDFSEFAFDPFPTLPCTIPGDDSLVLNYEFTPKVMDKAGGSHHYLIFHTTDGHYYRRALPYMEF